MCPIHPCALGDDNFNQIIRLDNTKAAWYRLQEIHGGTSLVKESNLDIMLTQLDKLDDRRQGSHRDVLKGSAMEKSQAMAC
jgi:hypothetical protein